MKIIEFNFGNAIGGIKNLFYRKNHYEQHSRYKCQICGKASSNSQKTMEFNLGNIIDSIKILLYRISHYELRSGYKCPKCGKTSLDSQEIFDCIYDHEYNKGK